MCPYRPVNNRNRLRRLHVHTDHNRHFGVAGVGASPPVSDALFPVRGRQPCVKGLWTGFPAPGSQVIPPRTVPAKCRLSPKDCDTQRSKIGEGSRANLDIAVRALDRRCYLE